MSAAEWEAHYWSLRDPDEGNPETAFFREELRRVIRANIADASRGKWKSARMRCFAATLRYLDGDLTLKEGAGILGVSAERFRQLKEDCIRRLRHLKYSRTLALYSSEGQRFLESGANQTSPVEKHCGYAQPWQAPVEFRPLQKPHRETWDCNQVNIHAFKIYPRLGYITKCCRCGVVASLKEVWELIEKADKKKQDPTSAVLWKVRAARA